MTASDHPVDHAPGMLLLEAVRQAVRPRAPSPRPGLPPEGVRKVPPVPRCLAPHLAVLSGAPGYVRCPGGRRCLADTPPTRTTKAPSRPPPGRRPSCAPDPPGLLRPCGPHWT
ncbi:AfsA-related hotdog domain-containing protein [Streptomyces virginiae]|uniref:AfsA-related hotdog domain-containing protein n=1 Tax=Streptomyces virginiae TaxID=1961 RepID=UPI0036FBC24D